LISASSSPYTNLTFGSCGGSSSHPKVITLTPEYANAVLWNNNNTTTDIGTMTASYTATGVGSKPENYYDWTTSQSTNQAYAIVVQIPLPSDFSSWGTTPITIDAYTSNTTNGTITAKLYDAGTIESAWNTCSLTPSSASTWTTMTGCALAGSYSGNTMITLVLILQAPTSGTTNVGNINLSYNSSY
jgi:hypothetical protein